MLAVNPASPASMPGVLALIAALEHQGDVIERQMRLVQGRSVEMMWSSDAATAMTTRMAQVVTQLGVASKGARECADCLRTHLLSADRGRAAVDAVAVPLSRPITW